MAGEESGAARESMETSFHFGPPGDAMLGVLHEPRSPGTARDCGVLLCGPLGHEHAFSRRLFVEWARVLAGAGFPVLRFDYRGHGDSSGRFEDGDVESLLADISLAAAELERRTGVSVLVPCGLRFGATLAALWAKESRPGSPLVLWEPAPTGRAYVAELRRIELVKKMAARSKASRPPKGAEVPGAGPGSIMVEGCEWTPRLQRSLEAVDLADELGAPGRDALIVRIASPAAPRPSTGPASAGGSGPAGASGPGGAAASAGVSASAGFPVSAGSAVSAGASAFPGPGATVEAGEGPAGAAPRRLATPPLWYGSFLGEYRSRCRPDALFAETLRWLLGRAGSQLGRAPLGVAEETVARAFPGGPGVAEEVVAIPTPGGALRGILTLPEPDVPESPVLVLAPHGYNPRAGWNRLHVRIARALAARGFRCLRFDALGFGDSDGSVDLELGSRVFLAIERGLHVQDTARAVSYCVERFGPAPVFVGGVCGGAATAALLAPGDPRLAGIALIELPLVLTEDPGVKEAQPLWRYRRKLLSPAAWRKVFSLRADFSVHLRSLRESVASRLGRGGPSPEARWFRAQVGPSANGDLLDALRLSAERGVPTLFVFGSTDFEETFERVRPRLVPGGPDRPRGGPNGTGASIRVCKVEGADHDFLLPPHAEACIDAVASWMSGCRAACGSRA